MFERYPRIARHSRLVPGKQEAQRMREDKQSRTNTIPATAVLELYLLNVVPLPYNTIDKHFEKAEYADQRTRSLPTFHVATGKPHFPTN